MTIRIPTMEIREILNETPDFDKYLSPLLNLANRFAQGTRPAVVGQMSDLIQEFTGQSLPEWEEWYLERHPEAIAKATQKILSMVAAF